MTQAAPRDQHGLRFPLNPAVGSSAASTYEVAASWLAVGLDPERVTFYKQSDLPEVFGLTWSLNCVTPKGLMNRAHARQEQRALARRPVLDLVKSCAAVAWMCDRRVPPMPRGATA